MELPQYPLIILVKDEGHLMAVGSLGEMENTLEKIDVENGEYEAWDSLGRQTDLSVQDEADHGHWLVMTIIGNQQDPSLRARIVSFLSGQGINIDPSIPFGNLISILPKGWS